MKNHPVVSTEGFLYFSTFALMRRGGKQPNDALHLAASVVPADSPLKKLVDSVKTMAGDQNLYFDKILLSAGFPSHIVEVFGPLAPDKYQADAATAIAEYIRLCLTVVQQEPTMTEIRANPALWAASERQRLGLPDPK
jgi:hypothetical protein